MTEKPIVSRVGTDAINAQGKGQYMEPSATPKPRAGEHTKGPWAVGPLDKNGQRVIRAEHLEVCTCWHHSVGALETSMENNAARIVACVNACEGLPTEELEQYAKHGPYTGYTDLKAERELLRERERELVEALEKIASCHSAFDGDVVSIAYKALAKVRP